jgi:hypothetical protein
MRDAGLFHDGIGGMTGQDFAVDRKVTIGDRLRQIS